VPPPLARAIATEIGRALRYAPRQQEDFIPLGDPELLRLGMSEAAKYFDVPITIGKRDRKSGTKKRKQHEIEAELGRVFPFEEPMPVNF
jgi:DNA (cytosine-5)-methyltransferase 1